MDDVTYEDAGEDFAVEVADLRPESSRGAHGRGTRLWRAWTASAQRLTARQRLWRLGSAAGGLLAVLLIIVGSSPSLRSGAVALFAGGDVSAGGGISLAQVPFYGPDLLVVWPVTAFGCALLLAVEALTLRAVFRGPEHLLWRRRLPLVPLAVALWSLWLALRACMIYWEFTRAVALGGDSTNLFPLYQGMQALPAEGLLTLCATYLLVMAGFASLALGRLQPRTPDSQTR